MSFWDLESDEGEGNGLEDIINNSESTIYDVLQNPDLILNFRSQEEFLINYLIKPDIIEQLSNILFKQDDKKMSKIVMQLVGKPNTSFFNRFIGSKQMFIEILADFDKLSSLQVGYLSQILITALSSTSRLLIFDLLYTDDIIIPLIKHIELLSIQEIFYKYILLVPESEQWLHILLLALLTKNIAINAKDNQSRMKSIVLKLTNPFSTRQETAMLRIILNFVSKYSGNLDSMNLIEDNIHLLPAYPVTYQIAMKLPYNENIYKRAISDSISPFVSPLLVESIKYLAKFPSVDAVNIFPALMHNFTSDQINAFHLSAFVDLTKSLAENVEEFSKFVPSLSEKILSICNNSSLRKNSAFIVHYIQIANIIDRFCTSEEWIKFRDSILSNWKDALSGEFNAAESQVSAIPNIIIPPSIGQLERKSENQQENQPNDEEFHFSEPQTTISSGDTGISKDSEFEFNFPDSVPEKKESTENFGGFFDDTDDKKDDFKFPDSIPHDEQKKEEFGEFFDEFHIKDDGFNFPDSIPKKNNVSKDDLSNFFDEVDFNDKEDIKASQNETVEKKTEENNDDFKFPDDIPEKKENSNDNLGGFFNDVNFDDEKKEETKKSDEFSFPDSIPQQKKDSNDNLGGLFNDVKFDDEKPQKSEDFNFPDQIPKPKQESNDNLGGFFDNMDDSDDDHKEKPTKSEEFSFPDSIPKQKQESNDNLGGFFNDVNFDDDKKDETKKSDEFSFPDSIPKPKEESNENLGGFFDNVNFDENKKSSDDFNFPDSIPKPKDESRDSLGGFFDNMSDDEDKEKEKKSEEFSFPDSIPEQKKDSNENLGGFFNEVHLSDDDNNKSSEDFKFPDSIPQQNQESNDNLGGFFNDTEEQPPKQEEKKINTHPEVKIPAFGEEINFPTTEQTETQNQETNNENEEENKESQKDEAQKQKTEEEEHEEEEEDIYAEAVIPEKPKIEEKKNDTFDPFANVEFPMEFPDEFTSGTSESDEDVAKKILNLMKDPTWESNWNTTEEFFAQENKFNTEEKCFLYLTEQQTL